MTRRPVARGELGYPKPGEVVASLRGAPIRDHFLWCSPADAMILAPDCAVQIVLAGNEGLRGIRRGRTLWQLVTTARPARARASEPSDADPLVLEA
jgi:hypothetical protein